jgi:uncharacterized protein YbaP (TraB family)
MKYTFLLSLIILSVNTLQAQLLWKISGNTLTEDSYLYGTIHVVPEDKFVVSESLNEAFQASSALALEIDLNITFEQQMAMAKELLIPGGKTLKNFLNSEEFQKFETYCLDTLGMKKSKFKKYIRIKPFFVSAIILKEQLGKSKGYDQYFNEEAKKKNIPTSGLETMQYQLSTVNTISIEDQANMLIASLGTEMIEYKKMLDLYLANDIEGLAALMDESEVSNESFTNNLLIQRNKNWIPEIEKLVNIQKTFIAVGAAHLTGENGVVKLLQNAGYIVEPINY